VRRALWLVILPVAIAATGCIRNFWRTVAVKVALPDTGTVAIRTPLKVHSNGGTYVSGTFAGIEPDGALRLDVGGEIQVIRAGDVHLS